MTYATQQDLIDRFGEAELRELADRDGDDVIDAAVVGAALNDASNRIDSYIGQRYDLPLATTPPLLEQLCCDIARHRLFKDDPPEIVSVNYNHALRALRDIADGRASLDLGGAEPAPAGDAVLTTGPDRVFTKDTLKGF